LSLVTTIHQVIRPSAADVMLAVELVQAGTLLDVEVLDHVIIGQGRSVSLKRLGHEFPKTTGATVNIWFFSHPESGHLATDRF
jgi:hypothetical protein